MSRRYKKLLCLAHTQRHWFPYYSARNNRSTTADYEPCMNPRHDEKRSGIAIGNAADDLAYEARGPLRACAHTGLSEFCS
jgi:hypothetical protein